MISCITVGLTRLARDILAKALFSIVTYPLAEANGNECNKQYISSLSYKGVRALAKMPLKANANFYFHPEIHLPINGILFTTQTSNNVITKHINAVSGIAITGAQSL
jgi:hypothetical protein